MTEQVEWVRSGFVRYFPALEPLMVHIDSIEPAPWNYNNGDLDAIQESIETNGMFEFVKVQKSTRHIFAGNHTWMACKMLGAEMIPGVFYDVTTSEAKRMAVAHNQTATLARPDPGLLLQLLDEIKEETGMLTGTAVSEQEVEDLRRLNDTPLDTTELSAQWPLFAVQLPPHVMKAFKEMTDGCGDDRERFETLMRNAGWQE